MPLVWSTYWITTEPFRFGLPSQEIPFPVPLDLPSFGLPLLLVVSISVALRDLSSGQWWTAIESIAEPLQKVVPDSLQSQTLSTPAAGQLLGFLSQVSKH